MNKTHVYIKQRNHVSVKDNTDRLSLHPPPPLTPLSPLIVIFVQKPTKLRVKNRTCLFAYVGRIENVAFTDTWMRVSKDVRIVSWHDTWHPDTICGL